MKPQDPGLDPEWRNLLKLRRVKRRVPPTVRARVLARSEAFVADKAARQPPPLASSLVGSRRGARPHGRPWLGVGLIVSVAVAGGAVFALRHHRPIAINEPAAPVTVPAPAASLPDIAPPAAAPLTPSASNVRRAPAADLLPAELALLQRARNAYVGRHFSTALGLLAEHARRFPHGRLAEEREALRVRALAASGRTEEARRAAAAFAARFPRSILLRHPHDGDNTFE